jgi:RNA polymerase sigma-70 factor (ECF subfamily)
MASMALFDDVESASPGPADRRADRSADRLAAGAVGRALEGAEDAFRWIVETFSSDMRQVAFVVCGSLDVAEEAVAASWPIAWRRLRTVRDGSRLRSWLVAIAANEARHIASRQRRRSIREITVEQGTGRLAAASGAPDLGLDRAESLDLSDALARLDPADRSLLAMRYVVGLNSTELASVTGLTPAGTRARLQRLLDRLRRELGDD